MTTAQKSNLPKGLSAKKTDPSHLTRIITHYLQTSSTGIILQAFVPGSQLQAGRFDQNLYCNKRVKAYGCSLMCREKCNDLGNQQGVASPESTLPHKGLVDNKARRARQDPRSLIMRLFFQFVSMAKRKRRVREASPIGIASRITGVMF